MSTGEARRPRRIIEAPPPSSHAAPQPLPRAAEKFQRALGIDRRALARGMAAAHAAAESRGDVAAGEADEAGIAVSAEAPHAGLETPVQEVSAAVEAVAGVLAAQESPADAQDEAAAVEPPLEVVTDRWAQQLVQTIVTLCVRTDPAIEAWAVTLPMDERTLPQTELHLSLSRHRISLRFHTQSPRSVTLLSSHRVSLAAMLQQALSKDRDIDIEVT